MSRTKADLLLHPVRVRIMTEFSGRERTSLELAGALPDIPQATLYRHIKVLVEGGALEIVNERRVNGAVERTYRVAQNGNRITPEEFAALTPEEHIHYFTLYTAALIDTYSDYIRGVDVTRAVENGLAFNRGVVYLTDEERAQFASEMNALVSRMMALPPEPARKRFTMASMVIPDKKNDQSDKE